MKEQNTRPEYDSKEMASIAIERAKTMEIGVEYTLENLLYEYNWKKVPLKVKSQAGTILRVFALNNADSYEIGGQTSQNQRKYIRKR
ncbi:MAG: hypothetical protein LBR73_10115 [Oscillospiraceae bacterium]|jgi:hypothetical protein|nr:hypothetical protein [Oscillospiraceae bacterium]